MMEAVDYQSDEDWRRVIYLRAAPKDANRIAAFSYPHFRRERVVKYESFERSEPIPQRRRFGGAGGE